MQSGPVSNLKREILIEKIRSEVINDLILSRTEQIRKYAADKDVAVRKILHSVLLRLYGDMKPYFGENMHKALTILLNDQNERVKQVALLTFKAINKDKANS